MKKTILILLVVFVIPHASFGQMGQRISAYVNVKGSESINYETEIPMLIVEPENGFFNPQDLLDAFPEIQVDTKKIELTLPELKAYSDTLYMMMLVKERAYSRRGSVNIVVIGVHSESRLDYFIDNNSDYSFSEGESKLTFSPAVERVRLDMKTRGGGENEFFLFNPIYKPSLVTTPRNTFAGSWEKIDRKFSLLLDLSGTFGSGNSTLDYKPQDAAIERVNYDALIFAFGLFRAGVVANWKNINLGIYGGFEQVQYTERNKFSYTQTGHENIDYMTGLWMWSKVSAEVVVEYDIKMSERIKLGPSVGAGIWMPIDKRVFDPDQNPPANAAYQDTWKYDLGVKMKMLINNDSYFTLKVGQITTNLDAREYLTDYSSDYKLKYSQIYLSLGYSVQLTNRQD